MFSYLLSPFLNWVRQSVADDILYNLLMTSPQILTDSHFLEYLKVHYHDPEGSESSTLKTRLHGQIVKLMTSDSASYAFLRSGNHRTLLDIINLLPKGSSSDTPYPHTSLLPNSKHARPGKPSTSSHVALRSLYLMHKLKIPPSGSTYFLAMRILRSNQHRDAALKLLAMLESYIPPHPSLKVRGVGIGNSIIESEGQQRSARCIARPS